MCYVINIYQIQVLGVWCYDDITNIENAIDDLEKQNKDLQKKMSTITAGLTEMCRAVNLATCDCKQTPDIQSRDIDNSNELTHIIFETEGEKNGSVKLGMKFEAADQYGIEWFQMFLQGNGMVRSPGRLQKIKLVTGKHLYASEIELFDLNLTRLIFIRIISRNSKATITLNHTAILEKGEQAFSDPYCKVTGYQSTLVLPNNLKNDYNFTLSIERSYLKLKEKRTPGNSYDLDYYLTYVNTTTDPFTVNEIYNNDMALSSIDNGIGDIDLVITIKKEHLENRGMFGLDIPQPASQYVERINYGIVIEIRREDFKSVVPPGSVAVYTGFQNVYIYTSVASIFCFAMGNPKPDITIFREQKGQLKKLMSDEVILDEVTRLKTVTLHDDDNEGVSMLGTYVCRASNGNETIDTRIQLKSYHPPRFDDRKTGVIVNNSRKVVVSCKASGTPTPEVEIRLRSTYGPNLLLSKGNFTHKTTVKNGSYRATITFSPPDSRFAILYCYATQGGEQFYDFIEKKIEVFPRSEDGLWSTEEWDFYNSFQESSDGDRSV